MQAYSPAFRRSPARTQASLPCAAVSGHVAEHGFTLLEVMVALAIMASVIFTVLGAVNYHIGIISRERDDTALTLLARARIFELEQGPIPDKSEGSFAPGRPEVKWRAELFPTELPLVRKLVVKVHRDADTREVALVRYILK